MFKLILVVLGILAIAALADLSGSEERADQARAQKLGLNYKTLVDQPEPAADKETP